MKDPHDIEKDLHEKLKSRGVSEELKEKIVKLWNLALESTSPRTRWLCVGALLYFINPFDAIPDVFFPMGFVDDMAVVTLVLQALKKDLLEKKD